MRCAWRRTISSVPSVEPPSITSTSTFFVPGTGSTLTSACSRVSTAFSTNTTTLMRRRSSPVAAAEESAGVVGNILEVAHRAALVDEPADRQIGQLRPRLHALGQADDRALRRARILVSQILDQLLHQASLVALRDARLGYFQREVEVAEQQGAHQQHVLLAGAEGRAGGCARQRILEEDRVRMQQAFAAGIALLVEQLAR